MQITDAQLIVLRNNIQSSVDPAVVAARGNGADIGRDDTTLAGLYNLPAAPDYYLRRTALSRHDILTATSDDGTTFAWAGAAYITRSQGERDAFREMFNSTGTVNPSLASIAAAFNDIFSGAGGAGNRAHILAMARRKASRVEALFAQGAGTKLAPSLIGYEGEITPSDLGRAFSL